MRMLTKAEACRELAVSLSTLNRRIASGEVPTKREPRGKRHRVYVMLDYDLPSTGDTPQSELAVAQKRIRVLEEQLEWERQSNAELVNELKAGKVQEQRGPWWRFRKPSVRLRAGVDTNASHSRCFIPRFPASRS